MLQRQSFSVDDCPALAYIVQKLPDILHAVQPVIPDTKGKRRIFGPISGAQHRTQTDGLLGRINRFLRNLQIALKHPPCTRVAAGHRLVRRLAYIGNHGGGKVLAAANVGVTRAGATDAQPSFCHFGEAHRISFAAADGAADVRLRVVLRALHVRDPSLPVIFHSAFIIGGGKQ